MASKGSGNQSDSDSEIVVVYNYKEARTQSAVEIVLDDDDAPVEMMPCSSRNVNRTNDDSNVGMIDLNSSPTRGINNMSRSFEDSAEASQNNCFQTSEIPPEESKLIISLASISFQYDYQYFYE